MEQPSVASIISTRRKALGLTQQALADQLHISNKSISKWETGEGLPDISILKELATALQISVDELLGKAPTPIVTPTRSFDKVRVFRVITASAILVVHVFPFVSLTLDSADPLGLGSLLGSPFGNNLSLVFSGYQLLTNDSWIGRFVLLAFVLNLVLLGLDLFKPTRISEIQRLVKIAHGTVLALAILIPLTGLASGLTLEIGLILSTVFNLSLSLSALLPRKQK